MKTITKKDQCTECDGRGYFIYDSCDHRGEHIQDEFPCETCEGSGVINSEAVVSKVY